MTLDVLEGLCSLALLEISREATQFLMSALGIVPLNLLTSPNKPLLFMYRKILHQSVQRLVDFVDAYDRNHWGDVCMYHT